MNQQWLVAADYSQLELRIIALLSGDVKLLDAYANDLDVHDMNTRDLFGVEDFTSNMRTLAKNFVYNCVPEDCEILTVDGWKPQERLRLGDVVAAYDSRTHVETTSAFVTAVTRQIAQTLKVDTDGGAIEATADHRWYCRDRIRQTWELQPGDEIIRRQFDSEPVDVLTVLSTPRDHKLKAHVWCPTTTLGSWIMRSGDLVTITGNCNYLGGAETIWQLLVKDFPKIKLIDIQRLLNKWFRDHPWIRNWHTEILTAAYANGYVEEPFSGIRLHFPDGKVEPTKVANHPVQTFAAHQINTAAIQIADRLDWRTESLWAQVHDELVLAGPDPVRLARLMQDAMSTSVEYRGHTMRFPIDYQIGTNWGEMRKAATIAEVERLCCA